MGAVANCRANCECEQPEQCRELDPWMCDYLDQDAQAIGMCEWQGQDSRGFEERLSWAVGQHPSCREIKEENLQSLSDLRLSKLALSMARQRSPKQSIVNLLEEHEDDQADQVLSVKSQHVDLVSSRENQNAAAISPRHCNGDGRGCLELIARGEEGYSMVLYCNGKKLLNSVPLARHYKLFRFDCPAEELVQSVELGFENDAWPAEFQLEDGFGFRLRGKDVLPCLTPCPREARGIVEEDLCGAATLPQIQLGGRLEPLSQGWTYRAETCLQFIAHGTLGVEELDVYVNGLTTRCEASIVLGCGEKRRRLFKYIILPLSAEIRSLVVRVRNNAGKVVIDSKFGVRVSGYDCLRSAVFIDPKTCVMNPHDWKVDSDEQKSVQDGEWRWNGYYYMRCYRRSRKPYRRESADHPESMSSPEAL